MRQIKHIIYGTWHAHLLFVGKSTLAQVPDDDKIEARTGRELRMVELKERIKELESAGGGA